MCIINIISSDPAFLKREWILVASLGEETRERARAHARTHTHTHTNTHTYTHIERGITLFPILKWCLATDIFSHFEMFTMIC